VKALLSSHHTLETNLVVKMCNLSENKKLPELKVHKNMGSFHNLVSLKYLI